MDDQLTKLEDELSEEVATILTDFVFTLNTYNKYLVKTRKNVIRFASAMNDYAANPSDQMYPETLEMRQFREEFDNLTIELDDMYGWAVGQNEDLVLLTQFKDYVTQLYVIVTRTANLVDVIALNPPDHVLAVGFQQYHSVLVGPATSFVSGIMHDKSLEFLITALIQVYDRITLGRGVMGDDGFEGLGILLDGPDLPRVR
jgi:soluble cytochrome b562